jgi:hypothetical protein
MDHADPQLEASNESVYDPIRSITGLRGKRAMAVTQNFLQSLFTISSLWEFKSFGNHKSSPENNFIVGCLTLAASPRVFWPAASTLTLGALLILF